MTANNFFEKVFFEYCQNEFLGQIMNFPSNFQVKKSKLKKVKLKL